MIWFSADQHFSHKNIIIYCERPFSSIEEMNFELIKNINSIIMPNDEFYTLGDFCFGPMDDKKYIEGLKQLREQINCQNIHLIFGNHDRPRLIDDYKKLFSSVNYYKELKYNKRHIVLCHYAMKVWNRSHHGSWMLYGHSHGTLPDDSNNLSIDVGIDCHNYSPLNFDHINEIMSKKSFKPVDHHNRKTT